MRLPVGRWRLTAFLVASTNDCLGAQSPGLLHASIDVEVLPENAGGIRLLAAAEPPTVKDECPANDVTGALVLDPISGLGILESSGARLPVRWPVDFAAEVRPEGAVLYDSIGFRFSREGEELSLNGSLAPDGIFDVCFPVGIVNDPVLPILP